MLRPHSSHTSRKHTHLLRICFFISSKYVLVLACIVEIDVWVFGAGFYHGFLDFGNGGVGCSVEGGVVGGVVPGYVEEVNLKGKLLVSWLGDFGLEEWEGGVELMD
jgi:hypothetical protein